jgi:hypothetical protein
MRGPQSRERPSITDPGNLVGGLFRNLRRYPALPATVRRPTICTAITFTSVIDGKIMA